MKAFLGKELRQTMYWKTTSKDIAGTAQLPWAKARSCTEILGPRPFPKESAIARSSALDPAYVTTRADFCEKECKDQEINKLCTDSFLPVRTTGHDPTLVKDSAYQRDVRGAVGKKLRNAKPQTMDISEYNCLDFFLQGPNLVKDSFASSQYGPPLKGHPTRGDLFVQ